MSVRELIEKVRRKEKTVDELIESIKDRKLEQSELYALRELLMELKDEDEQAYKKLHEFLEKHMSSEELEAYEEENIEEYEERGAQ